MCTTCGCGAGEVKIEGLQSHAHDPHWHVHADGTAHSHGQHEADYGSKFRPVAMRSVNILNRRSKTSHNHPANAPASHMVQIERNILSKNDRIAAANRESFRDYGILALNLVSSPGSGKTSLLVRTVAVLKRHLPIAVVEGDQQTSRDAERIREAGAPAVQINTGKGCHLDAAMVSRALPQLSMGKGAVLFIENVGNLVCPAAFALGESAKVVILSVTEGEDKPLKYRDMFRAARLLLLNKCDLLPYLDFDVDAAIDNARKVNPAIEIIRISAKTGEGMAEWLAWLARERDDVLAAMPHGERNA